MSRKGANPTCCRVCDANVELRVPMLCLVALASAAPAHRKLDVYIHVQAGRWLDANFPLAISLDLSAGWRCGDGSLSCTHTAGWALAAWALLLATACVLTAVVCCYLGSRGDRSSWRYGLLAQPLGDAGGSKSSKDAAPSTLAQQAQARRQQLREAEQHTPTRVMNELRKASEPGLLGAMSTKRLRHAIAAATEAEVPASTVGVAMDALKAEVTRRRDHSRSRREAKEAFALEASERATARRASDCARAGGSARDRGPIGRWLAARRLRAGSDDELVPRDEASGA